MIVDMVTEIDHYLHDYFELSEKFVLRDISLFGHFPSTHWATKEVV